MTVKRFIVPVNAAGPIQNLRTTSVTQTTVAIAWNQYSGATGYQIRRNGTLLTTVTPGTTTTYTNTGHTAGTSYTYAVRPVVGGSGVASAEASINVTTVGAGGTLLVFDGFDYVVDRNTTYGSRTASPFVTAGPWSTAKAVNASGEAAAYGYLYTVSQAEMQATTGHTGPLPGSGARCLKMELPPNTPQSDFYVGLGTSPNVIPANVWFQFWLFSPNGGAETANILGRQKFLYPTNNSYPSSTCKWLFSTSDWTAAPYEAQPFGAPTSGQVCFNSRDNVVGTVNYSVGDPSNANKLGPNVGTASNGFMAANQWTLVKIHYDTSNDASGVFEMWLRPYGGAWRKVAEWIGGVTPNFSWSGFGAGGHSGLIMPSTWPGNNAPNTRGGYYYMDDFAMATAETALPQYG